MPRYLLFGDTVDIASHMESSGESMKIHISQTTVAILMDNAPNIYTFEQRLPVNVKGLENQATFWLYSKNINNSI